VNFEKAKQTTATSIITTSFFIDQIYGLTIRMIFTLQFFNIIILRYCTGAAVASNLPKYLFLPAFYPFASG